MTLKLIDSDTRHHAHPFIAQVAKCSRDKSFSTISRTVRDAEGGRISSQLVVLAQGEGRIRKRKQKKIEIKKQEKKGKENKKVYLLVGSEAEIPAMYVRM